MKSISYSALVIFAIMLTATTIFAESPCTRDDVLKVIEKAVSILEKKQAKGLQEVGKLRFCGNNYVFVNDFKGRTLMHIRKHLIGKVLLGLKDDTGKLFFADFTRAAKSSQISHNGIDYYDGSGWVRYRWPKPGANSFSPKSAYIKGLLMGQENVYVGAGIYD